MPPGSSPTPVRVPERAGQLPRRRRRARGPARPARRRLAVGAGPVAIRRPAPTTSTSNCWPTSARYAPGDTARIVVRGRDVVGPVLLTKEGQRVSWHQVVRPTVAGAFEIPMTDGDIGDVYVNVVLLRDGRLLQAERRLVVPPVSRTLQIALTADRPVAKPQEPASFAVQVTDAAGQPVRASVSLAVIDEAVFGVKADDTPDPARVFYRREYSRVSTAFSRDYHFTGLLGRRAAAAGVAAPAAAVAGRLQGRPAGPAAGAQGVPRCHPLGGVAGDRRRGARTHHRALSRFAHDVAADRARRHHRHAGRRRRGPHDDDQGPDRPAGDAAVPHRGRRRWRRRPSSTTTSTTARETRVAGRRPPA